MPVSGEVVFGRNGLYARDKDGVWANFLSTVLSMGMSIPYYIYSCHQRCPLHLFPISAFRRTCSNFAQTMEAVSLTLVVSAGPRLGFLHRMLPNWDFYRLDPNSDPHSVYLA